MVCFLGLLLSTTACTNGRGTLLSDRGDTLKLKYARGLTIVKHREYTVVDVADPWHHHRTLHRYILVGVDKDIDLPEGTIVRTPLSRAVVFTTVHNNLFMELKAGEVIKGVCDLKYIKIPWIQEQCRKGDIADCGNGMSPDVEKIIDMKPDAILLSPFENSGGYGKLEEIDIPLIECADYMESSPLGRAEWMKFFGMLVGRESEADSLFNAVERNYQNLRKKAARTKRRPAVMIDKRNGGVWYVPGGESTIGRLVADAGGDYVFAGIKKSGSVSMNLETALDQAGNADLWLFRYNSDRPATYKELATEYGGYRQLKAFKSRKAYGCNTATSRFYEESPFRPDLLLSDFIRIIHPEVTGLPALRYFESVK